MSIQVPERQQRRQLKRDAEKYPCLICRIRYLLPQMSLLCGMMMLLCAAFTLVSGLICAETDTAADAAEPAGHITLPHLTARLDIAAILQVSASFFREIRLAEAGGLTAQVAHDIVTDRSEGHRSPMTSVCAFAAALTEQHLRFVFEDSRHIDTCYLNLK